MKRRRNYEPLNEYKFVVYIYADSCIMIVKFNNGGRHYEDLFQG